MLQQALVTLSPRNASAALAARSDLHLRQQT